MFIDKNAGILSAYGLSKASVIEEKHESVNLLLSSENL